MFRKRILDCADSLAGMLVKKYKVRVCFLVDDLYYIIWSKGALAIRRIISPGDHDDIKQIFK